MNTILVYLYDTCVISEVTVIAWMVNGEQDWQIKTIAEKKELIKSLEGWNLTPDMSIDEFKDSEEIKGLIFPGGIDIVVGKKLQNIINKFQEKKKLLGAICAGPTFLALAGILDEIQYTTTKTPEAFKEKNQEDPFPRQNFKDTRCIRDKNIITATGVAFLEFADLVFDFLKIYNKSEERTEFQNWFTPKW